MFALLFTTLILTQAHNRGVGHLGHLHPENFEVLHSNFNICKNFQRIKMRFYILILKMFNSILKIFRNAVCLRFDFVS